MELRQFRYFVAVAEELHFGRAAERLHIVQPALSKQVKNLEEELGARLLDRNKREVKLTEAGRLFLEEAKKVLEHAERAAEAAGRAARGEVGRLSVGFITPATFSVLPRVTKLFKSRYPDVELELCQLRTAEQMEALREERIQVGFVREPAYCEDPSLRHKTILQEPLILALPETHALASESSIPLRTLADEPFIMFSPILEPGLYAKYMQVFGSAGFTPRVVQETPHIQAILGLVAEGVGLMLVPAYFRNLARKGIAYRELQGITPKVDLAVVWRSEETSPVLAAFLEVVEEICAQPVEF